MRHFFLFLFSVFAFSISCASAEVEDFKAQFVEAWEAHISALETTLFPYQGKIKLLNVAISKDISYYYDYDLNVGEALKGVAEVKLLDAPDEFFHSMTYSHQLWLQEQFLFSESVGSSWLTAGEWTAQSTVPDALAPQDMERCPTSQVFLYTKVLPLSVLLAVFVLFLIVLMRKQRKLQQRYAERYDYAIELSEKQVELLNKLVESKKD